MNDRALFEIFVKCRMLIDAISTVASMLADGPDPLPKWRSMIDLNLVALSMLTRAAVQDMRSRGVNDGHIVHIGRWANSCYFKNHVFQLMGSASLSHSKLNKKLFNAHFFFKCTRTVKDWQSYVAQVWNFEPWKLKKQKIHHDLKYRHAAKVSPWYIFTVTLS
jgi:NAD(P)-dependent dehydrogenase (short-subunit alcohol dehydrogenase family)